MWIVVHGVSSWLLGQLRLPGRVTVVHVTSCGGEALALVELGLVLGGTDGRALAERHVGGGVDGGILSSGLDSLGDIDTRLAQRGRSANSRHIGDHVVRMASQGEAEGPRDRFPRSTEEFPGEAEMVPTEDEEVELDLDRGLGEGKFMEPGEFRTYFGGVGTFLMSVFLLSLGSPMSSLCSSVMGRSAYLSWGWTR